jgi:serine protease AprX
MSVPRINAGRPALLLTLSLVVLAGLLFGGQATAVTGNNDGHVVVIVDPLAWAVVNETAQPVRVIDYDTFLWVELEPAQFARLQASGIPFEPQANPFQLTLSEQTFDPLVALPDLPAGWAAGRAAGPDFHLVQLAGPPQPEWLAGLESQELAIVQYIYPNSYIVWGEDVTARTAAFDFVRWSGPFAPAYRVLPPWRNLSAEPVEVHILLYRGADLTAVTAQLGQLANRPTGRAVLNDSWEIIGLLMNGDRLQAAAQIPGVYTIQPVPTDGGLRGEMSNQINVNNHDASNLAYPGYAAWLTSVGLSGAGVIIANVDSGIQDSHPDLVNRMLPCSGVTCGGAASSSHGTHTAGIMAGDGASGVVDSFGFLRGQGVAPGANLVEQLYSPTYTQPGGMLLLIRDSHSNGALLSGNSWGPAGTPRGYDNNTMQVDMGVRDADANAAGNQQFSYVLSIMNGNGGTSTQGTPDEAKNIFTIGSTKMQNTNGTQILDINDLSANSAHGPALDGRKIPHLVAPGCRVDSSIPTNSYGLSCGTSMASPHVSGAVALFIEYYRDLFGVDPTPAMIKAAFLPVAHSLAGFRDASNGILGHPFDSKQGWGRMDLDAVVNPQAEVQYFADPYLFLNTGEEWVQQVGVADPSKPLRVMLVWTDAHGHGLGGSTPAWNNDLNLIVEIGGQTYRGNAFGSGGWSTPGGAADFQNNTEGVFVGPTASGSATIRVVAANLNSDGVPGNDQPIDQDFALVCYNCSLFPDYNAYLTPNSEVETMPAMVVEHTFALENLGLTDSYTVSVSGFNWATTLLSPASIDLAQGETATITVQVAAPALAGDPLLHSDSFLLTVQSANDAGLTLTATGQTSYHVEPAVATSGDDVQIGALGQTLTYTIALTNTGNYTDTFLVEVGGSAWAAISDMDEVGPLAPGETAVVTIFVTVGHGAADSVTIRFVSSLDAAVWAEAVLYSETRLLFLPILLNP